MHRFAWPVLSLLLVFFQAPGYGAAQHSGDPRLGPLVDRAMVSREALQGAVGQFQADREMLSALAKRDDEYLQTISAEFFKNYTLSVEAAVQVSSAVAAVEQAANAIFQQWQEEIEAFTDARLKADNQAKFEASSRSYEGLIQSLRQSEAKIDPVLAALKSNVVFFKWNHNAGAVASRREELLTLEQSIEALIELMDGSISRMAVFVNSMQ